MASFPQPGVYDMPADEYLDVPAMSASGAVVMVGRCPLVFWHSSPWNPDYVPERKRNYDFGTSAHLALLEPDKFAERVALIDAEDYRTKAAKEARDAAYAADKVPLLAHLMPQIQAIRDAFDRHGIARDAFKDGHAERSFFWIDAEFNIPCKARPDFVRRGNRYIADLKTTEIARPDAFERRAYELGYFQRAAWYLEGVEAVEGVRPKEFWLVVIERDPPHALTVCKIDERALEWGALMNRKAKETFAWCREHDEAPNYRHPDYPDRDRAFTIGLPGYAEMRLAERLEAGEFTVRKPSQELLRRGFESQAPLGVE
jgi:uncharacterized small protein (DUF1192 family)